jgi:hypothetical protein
LAIAIKPNPTIKPFIKATNNLSLKGGGRGGFIFNQAIFQNSSSYLYKRVRENKRAILI